MVVSGSSTTRLVRWYFWIDSHRLTAVNLAARLELSGRASSSSSLRPHEEFAVKGGTSWRANITLALLCAIVSEWIDWRREVG